MLEQHEYGMLDHIRRYPWVISDTYMYRDISELMNAIEPSVIIPAETKVRELRSGGQRAALPSA